MEGIPESLRPGAEISDSPNFVPVDVYGPADFQSPGTSAYPFPHVGDECPCICGMCCCRTHAAQAPREPVQQARLEELDDDNETIGPGSSISGPPSSVGRSTMGPHVTNVDPFNLRSQEEPPESIIEEEPLPVQLNLIEPIGDPAFSPNLMSPVPERVNPISPLAYSPLGLDVFPASPAVQIPPPLGNLSEENFPEFPVPDQWQEVEQTPPPPRPNFNIILQDPPDFPPVHRKTIQVILRIKPVFVDCLDVLHDILPRLDELSADMDVQSKQDVCLDLEGCLKNLWFILPPRHSCDDTMDCRHWHQRFIERMEQLAEKMVSFLDELRTSNDLSKFSYRMDQYHRVFDKWIKKFEQYHSLIRINPEP